MQIDIKKFCDVKRSVRTTQLEGIYDIPRLERQTFALSCAMPIEDFEWNIGAIIGPSGTGKSLMLKELGYDVLEEFDFDERSVVDNFPQNKSITEIVGELSSVGFSSPTSWLKPFSVLSNGEKFRVQMARLLCEARNLYLVDEFTSVVDRTVAQIASAAIAKGVRREKKRLVVASCHYDIVEWLQPDWVFDTLVRSFTRRSLQRRPAIRLDVFPATREAWPLFAPYHYLSQELSMASKCFVGLVRDRPATFTAVLPFPTRHGAVYREHRSVCLPDFQGVGLGNRMSETIAACYRALKTDFFSTTSHPAMIRHRAKSPFWTMIRAPGITGKPTDAKQRESYRRNRSGSRYTASFRFDGTPDEEGARILGVI